MTLDLLLSELKKTRYHEEKIGQEDQTNTKYAKLDITGNYKNYLENQI